MKLIVNQEKVSRALASCGRVASSKAGLPILDKIILRTTKNKLHIIATNLELASSTILNAKVDTQGDIAVPAKLINDVIATLPKGNIELELQGLKLHIHSGAYSAVVNGSKTDEFPDLPTINEATAVQYSINQNEFKQSITQTTLTASKDVTRPVLTGVFIHSHDGFLYAASSDGYRLAERRIIATKSDVAAIIPASSLTESLRLITDDTPDITLLCDEGQVRIRVGDTELTSRLIEGSYPNYRELIPKKTETNVDLDAEPLVRTAKLAGLFSRSTGGSITFNASEANQTLIIASTASEDGENEAVLSGVVSGDGQVSLNSRYLLEALSAIQEPRITIGYNGKLSPIVLRPATKESNYTHIIMPLKS